MRNTLKGKAKQAAARETIVERARRRMLPLPKTVRKLALRNGQRGKA